jgi:hypothetical protein
MPPPPAVKGDADDPIVKEARSDTETILKNVLLGKTGDDTALAQIAGKLKGFESWTIERQELDKGEPKTVNFTGRLSGPGREASFRVSVTKQMNGKWAIGTFRGPDRLED